MAELLQRRQHRIDGRRIDGNPPRGILPWPGHGRESIEDPSTIFNMSYREGVVNKAAVVIRDIAGSHIVVEGNKRTTEVLVGRMLAGKVSPERISAVTLEAAKGDLRTVEEIAHALEQ